MSSTDPTHRFTDRVDAYVRHRPRYPAAVVELVRREIGLTRDWVIADIGSGTGFSAEPFLRNGNVVIGVEPNEAMRQAAGTVLRDFPRFRSIAGTAESTTLAAESVDLLVAGQAFHWFDRPRARAEFRRILREPRWVVLIWYTRRIDSTAFLRAYEDLLLRHGTDYRAVRHDAITREEIGEFLGGDVAKHALPNEQLLDLEGLEGRLLSSSYMPAPGDPAADPMLRELRRIFDDHQEDGHVRLEYDTEIYIGRLR